MRSAHYSTGYADSRRVRAARSAPQATRAAAPMPSLPAAPLAPRTARAAGWKKIAGWSGAFLYSAIVWALLIGLAYGLHSVLKS